MHASTWSERYAYNGLGDLASAAHTASRASQESDAVVPDYEYAGGRIRQAGRTTYEYDGQGRRTKVRRRTLSGQVREWTYR
ncbi:hypothetical protein [Actinospica robiniae]|uniref:hypothetical protein n=1 Tax=Actinospica robiniae TaxID=304901 RepID=UPI0003FBC0E6|nr:hypothetical protein [Actinospica robiniae]